MPKSPARRWERPRFQGPQPATSESSKRRDGLPRASRAAANSVCLVSPAFLSKEGDGVGFYSAEAQMGRQVAGLLVGAPAALLLYCGAARGTKRPV